MKIALKEWATVCSALETGRQIILLRKGGISESIGGFEIEQREFCLFPTLVHQKKEMLKPGENFAPADAEPNEIKISSWAKITDIIQVPDRPTMDRLDDAHIWASPLIDMRFNYKPKNPLYLLVMRAYRIGKPATIQNLPEYAGCKSWVPLNEDIRVDKSLPAMTDEAFDFRRQDLLNRIK